MPKITLLGTGTCQIEADRRASSILIEMPNTKLLFDCGHGVVQRLLEVGIEHCDINYVVLSHFHPDHVSDLVPFLHAGAWSKRNPRQSDLVIFGPYGVQEFIRRILNIFEPNDLQRPNYQIIAHEITDGHFHIDSYQFGFTSLPPSGNHGVRFEWNGKKYALTGDSHFHNDEIEFLRNTEIAVIDAGHLEDMDIVSLAVSSQANLIVCSHINRILDIHAMQSLAESRGYLGTIVEGHDLTPFVF